MRAVVQRVTRAKLSIVDTPGSEREHARVGPGLVVLAGIEAGDTQTELAWLAGKLPVLRIFEDDDGRMNRSLLDRAGSGEDAGLLIVPNFTVAGRARKGRRPDFTSAKAPGEASEMFDRLVGLTREAAPGVDVQTGVFGAHMRVDLLNDGPVTIWLDSAR